MIGKITGKVDHLYKNAVTIDVHGVGYRVSVPAQTLMRCSEKGSPVSLFTYTHVREDALALYGFESLKELSLFEKLLTIAGVGTKTALSVVSSGTIEEITQAAMDADIDYFSNISGIGRKTAQRIIIDLKATLGVVREADLFEVSTPAYEETIQALRQFGFTAAEARDTLRTIKNKSKLTTEQLLKEALKTIGK